jgi:putative YhbY family RNA-binding protein
MRRTDEDTASKEKGAFERMSRPTAAKKRSIKRKLSEEKPTVWVGKGGASAELLKEIDRQLAKKETVKARILRSVLSEQEAKQVASTIADRTRASLVEARGHTFTLYRPHDKEKP